MRALRLLKCEIRSRPSVPRFALREAIEGLINERVNSVAPT